MRKVQDLVIFTSYVMCVTHAQQRDPKIFSIFNIVRIPNLPCTVGSSQGVCYSPTEIGEKGLTSLGSCASGFGLCGTQIRTANGESLDAPISYLQNPDYPATTTASGSKTNEISVSNTDVCQIRLDFEEFEMDPVITDGATQGKCSDGDFMEITSDLFSGSRNQANNVQQGGVGDLCGINTGQHMYIGDFNSTNNEIPGVVAKIKTILSSGNAAKYKVKVTQIDCKSSDMTMMDLRAPPDCRQFFRNSSGTVTSYNFGANGIDVYEKNQDYKVCIRRQIGDCQITWTRTDSLPAWYTGVGKLEYDTTGLEMEAITNFFCFKTANAAAPGLVSNNACGYDFGGAGCIRGTGIAGGCNDWIMIPEGRYEGTTAAKWGQNDIYCGVGVGWDEDAAAAALATDGLPTYPTTPHPGVVSQAGGGWSLRFHTSDLSCTGVTVAPTKHNARVGFSLDYNIKSSCADTTLGTAHLTRTNQPQIQASVVENANPVVTSESEVNVSLKQLLQEMSWMKQILANQSTPGPISTTKEPHSRYEGWNRFPYEETPRNFFKNPPGIH